MAPRRPTRRKEEHDSSCNSADQSCMHLRPAASNASDKERCRAPRPVLYKSSALAATAPSLAFKRYDSTHIAAAAAEADEVREKFKSEQLEAAGVAEVEGESEEAACAKKYVRRLLLNRHSAAASRLRKEAYVSALEKQLSALENEYRALLEQYGVEVNRVLAKKTHMEPPLVTTMSEASEEVTPAPCAADMHASLVMIPTVSALPPSCESEGSCNDSTTFNGMLPLSNLDMLPFFRLE
jgi:bZIP transcription factor